MVKQSKSSAATGSGPVLVPIFGNNLVDPQYFKELSKTHENLIFFMREDARMCEKFRYHKHKLIFVLSAMRQYRDELKDAGFKVHYHELEQAGFKVHYHELGSDKLVADARAARALDGQSYTEALGAFIEKHEPSKILFFEIEDLGFEKLMRNLFSKSGIPYEELPSPLFLTPRQEFQDYLKSQKRPFMKTFYERQRKRLKILVDSDGKPEGGKWSFDEENRKPLPKNHEPPRLPLVKHNATVKEVIKVIEKHFPSHPGSGEDFWVPSDRAGAHEWLKTFLVERFEHFGPYEDALAPHSDFVYHSALTPFLNFGLLHPSEVVNEALKLAKQKKIPLASLEGFIRQVIGWREFIRGIYQNFNSEQESRNFFKHERALTEDWYTGTTGVPILDRVIKKTSHYGYAHHIERLMVLGNMMQLLEVHPHDAHRWFMEMFIDSATWVMGPNVYGMALMSDGGIFATKPYICGSNYFKKMGEPGGAWQDAIDGLYWQFIDRKRDFFKKNPRMAVMVGSLDKMAPARKKEIFAAADALRARITRKRA
jgi:deoxyribodipyrimidine photolyase-related protein